jgi:release factor glutamine methyltransferase
MTHRDYLDNPDSGRHTYDEYLEASKKLLEESEYEQEPYEVTVAGKQFVVLPGVFSPKYFNDTELFATHLPSMKGQRVLEIGPGTGAISVIAVTDKGAHAVVAIDINPKAVENTRTNIEHFNLQKKIEVRKGDVYSALKPGETFDTIFWNTPFGYVENEDLSDLERALYDTEYKSTERFIKEASKYLTEGGRLLIGFSTTLGKAELIETFAKAAGFTLRLLSEFDSKEIHPVKFEIFEARKKEK